MTVTIPLATGPDLILHTAVFDLNGTITVGGQLIADVAAHLSALKERLRVVILSSDTYGTLSAAASALDVPCHVVGTGGEKAELLGPLDPSGCAAIGNGANDVAMLRACALGIAVLGPEGLAPATLAVADILCASVSDACDLLLHPQRVTATLKP